jgi:hypothetical protein
MMNMSSHGEKLISGELSGSEYFEQLAIEGLSNGTFFYDESGAMQRSDTAPRLGHLPGHEPTAQPPTIDELRPFLSETDPSLE